MRHRLDLRTTSLAVVAVLAASGLTASYAAASDGAVVAGPRSAATDSGSAAGDIHADLVVGGIGGKAAEGQAIPIPEGPAFDRAGSLFFVSAYGDKQSRKVFKVDLATKQVRAIYGDATSVFTSLDIHRDGRLFLTSYLGGPDGAGQIVTMNPDGSNFTVLVDSFKGTAIYPDDLVFDRSGNFYYTDMQGNAQTPTGRVIRVSTSGRQTLVADKLAFPNGIALNAAENRIWVAEHLANRLTALDITAEGTLRPGTPGAGISAYAYFSGGLVDGLTVDSADNIYQAMFGNGEVVALNPAADPVRSIWAGTRPQQNHPNSSSTVIKPGTRQGYLMAGGPGGISIWSFRAMAEALPPFSHR